MLKDISAAADVFAFASDQTGELVSSGALYRVTKNKDEIVANNTEASISAATVDGELYGYPSSSDTYFMYYDKSKFSDEEVKSLDTMLAKDIDGVTTNVAFDLDNGWYQCAFFFGAGCTLFGADGLDPTSCDFNNEQGYKVGEYLLDLVGNSKFGNNFDDGLVKCPVLRTARWRRRFPAHGMRRIFRLHWATTTRQPSSPNSPFLTARLIRWAVWQTSSSMA